MLDIQKLLLTSIERAASDIHIVTDYLPYIRINNELYPLNIETPVTKEESEKVLFAILTEEQKENLLANKEIDFGYEFGQHRFRVNMYYAKNKLAAAFRLIPAQIKTLEQLQMPGVFHEFSKTHQGLVLITGPTGEGKSTTLASIINEINMNQSKHVITIEDPIEYVYPVGKSIISQRELHLDTYSWNIALRSVLREDPDVVLVGEMRDFDTIQAVLTIAETGHLVFSTLHTNSTPDAINRIIDVFPSHQQSQVRSQLASVLKAVVTQRLIPDIENKSRVPAVEVLLNIPSAAALIREGKTHMLDSILETEEERGLILYEKYLLKLYKRGLISKETALNFALRENEIKKFLM